MTSTLDFQTRRAAEPMAALPRPLAALLLGLFIGSIPCPAADYPQAQISNGQIAR